MAYNLPLNKLEFQWSIHLYAFQVQPTQNVQSINLSTKDIDINKKCKAFGIGKDMSSLDIELQYKEVVVTKCEVESESRICTADDQNHGVLCLVSFTTTFTFNDLSYHYQSLWKYLAII